MLKITLLGGDPAFVELIEQTVRPLRDIHLFYKSISFDDFIKNLPSLATADVVIIDSCISDRSAFDVIPTIRRRFPNAEIILITPDENIETLIKALSLGATGLLNSNFSLDKLPNMLGILARGGALISPKLVKEMVQHIFLSQVNQAADTVLSYKEIQILRMFETGLDYNETASILNLSINGVRYHVKNIYKKLNVKNKSQAIRLFKNEQAKFC